MIPRKLQAVISYLTTMLAGIGFFSVCFFAGFYFGRV